MTKLELLNKQSIRTGKVINQISNIEEFYRYASKRVGWAFFVKVLKNLEFTEEEKQSRSYNVRLSGAKALINVGNKLPDATE